MNILPIRRAIATLCSFAVSLSISLGIPVASAELGPGKGATGVIDLKSGGPDAHALVLSGVAGTTSEAAVCTLASPWALVPQVDSLAIEGADAAAFRLLAPPALPLRFDASHKTELKVLFVPPASKTGVLRAALTATAGNANASLALRGLATKGKAGGNEPPLSQVLETLGCKVDVGGTKLILGTQDKLIGEELAAPLFRKAGEGAVSIVPLARYSPDEPLPFGYYMVQDGAPQRTVVATMRAGKDQTLLPKVEDGGKDSFDPGTAAFGLFTQSPTDKRITYTQAQWNTGIKHAVRVYHFKDADGAAQSHRYIVCFEEATNGDYQDYVFALGNAEPAN